MTPWPRDLGTVPESNIGYWGDGDVAVIRVEPDAVEVAADTAFEHGCSRQLNTFIRPHRKLRPADTAWPR